MRGGGWNSLRTLGIFENNRLRPLLLFSESDRKTALQIGEWPVFDDESNDSPKYLRNRMRLEVLPILLREGIDPEKIYRNFHDQELPRVLANDRKEEAPELQTVSRQILEKESGSVCKQILDLHLKVLGLHPLNTSFLNDLLNKLDTRVSFSLENKEAWFWKSVSSDLYILPKKADCLNSFQFDPEKSFLRWNGKTKRIPKNCIPTGDGEGERILLGGIHRDVSEILREKEIPLPVRKMLPILKREGKTVLVCLRMWDARLDDVRSDDFQQDH
ncbi:tRNA(Ile)-lysidine synthetase [Leptospira langatensis]|uniref:tRNA(Ile)-lysidine synthetase n=1 Tax=Leptospira langatensis TaxID=2484983 RepID=A0A5F1ZVE9_9LEPT|nr:tRNA(Ile)-lysidine synthetase [Leptospira langatensis]TGL42430.1 tRNA(Ile)-lysidine synthetase [Leptospira langatensis]